MFYRVQEVSVEGLGAKGSMALSHEEPSFHDVNCSVLVSVISRAVGTLKKVMTQFEF